MRQLIVRAGAAAMAGAAGGALGTLMLIARPAAGFIAAGALLGAVLVGAAWHAASSGRGQVRAANPLASHGRRVSPRRQR